MVFSTFLIKLCTLGAVKTNSILVRIKWNVASRPKEMILVLCSGETHQCAGPVSGVISAKKMLKYFAGSSPKKGRMVAHGHIGSHSQLQPFFNFASVDTAL